MSLHSWYGGCAGSGLKLIRAFKRALWTYVVAGLDNVRFVIILSLVLILAVSVSFVGVVSPSMSNTVPKCFVYVLVSVGWCGAVSRRVCVAIVASTGHCRSKFHAKLLKVDMSASLGALCIFT